MSGQLFCNQQWITGAGAPFKSVNPANMTELWCGHAASSEDVHQAVNSAQKAFDHWAITHFDQRKTVIQRFHNILIKEEKALAELISLETGKPLWESTSEVHSMQRKISLSVEAYHERTGNKVNILSSGSRTVIKHRPHGVLAILGPYNFPGHLPNGHIIPALLAGNTIVFKPSEFTPAVGEYTIKLWEQAGLPPGVINLVQGKKETGQALSSHKDIDGLLFTGSSTTGHLLYHQLADYPAKIVALEMGGNNPLIVDETVDEKAAAYHIIQSAFITSGQRCNCARRLFIPEGNQGDAIIKQLINTTQHLKIGLWNDNPQPFMGPLISPDAVKKIVTAQQQLINMGGHSLLTAEPLFATGAWINPGIIDVTAIENLPDKEYFGPLLQVIRYQTFTQAVQQANNTHYGLSAALFSADEKRFTWFEQHINAGIVNWNRQTTGASGNLPFGGIGASGNHRASGWYAADYCAYPTASILSNSLVIPETLTPGLNL